MSKSSLFSKIKIGSKTFRNRIILSPMCQYKAENGFVNEWHFQHYSRFAFSGLGGAFIEATAVSKEGRITHGCTGLWHDEQIEGLKKLTQIFKEFGCLSGIQLAHSGRKGSHLRPWDGATSIPIGNVNEPPWRTYAPSPIPIKEGFQTPQELSHEQIIQITTDFSEAAKRANEANFDLLEIHGAHGYLLHSFISPISNKRQDKYGGNLQKRMLFPLEVVTAVRKVWPKHKPLFFRLSAIDGPEGGTSIKETIILANALHKLGVDIVDCSSGGIKGSPTLATKKIVPGFQVPFSEEIKRESSAMTMAVGAIINYKQAEEIISRKRADLVAIGRELLADTQWVYKAALNLVPAEAKNFLPESYSFYLTRRDACLDRDANPK